MTDSNVLFIELQAAALEPGKPFDGLAPGTFYDMWGRKVTVNAKDFPDFVANTKKAIEFLKTADGEVVGLPIDAFGHYDDQAAGWIVDITQEEVKKPDGKKMPVLRFTPKWTEVGKELIEKGIRRLFSATFDNDEKTIHGGSLTNWPASRDDKGNVLLRPVALSQAPGMFYLADEVSLAEFDDSPWDGPAVASSLDVEDLRKVSLMDLNGYPGQEGDPTKSLCKLAYKKTPSSAPNRNAVRACGSTARGLPAVKKPEGVPEDFYNSKRKAAANKIISLWRAAFDNNAPGIIYDIAGKDRPAEMSQDPDLEGEKIMTLQITQEELDARIASVVETSVGTALQKALGAQPPVVQTVDPGSADTGDVDLIKLLGLQEMEESAVKSIETKLQESFKTIQKQAETRYLIQLAKVNRKRDMTELAQKLVGGVEDAPRGIPAEAEKLAEALLALPEGQSKFWTDLLGNIQKSGLTSFAELGHGKPLKGVTPLPEEYARALDTKEIKLEDLSNPTLAQGLGDLAQYDLSKWQTA